MKSASRTMSGEIIQNFDSDKCENAKLKSNNSNKFSIENILGLNDAKGCKSEKSLKRGKIAR